LETINAIEFMVTEEAQDIEPRIASLLDRKRTILSCPPYLPLNSNDVAIALRRLIAEDAPGLEVFNIQRMAGGRSKEQFTFEASLDKRKVAKYVLRIDPLQGAVETDRQREQEVLRAAKGTVPVPDVPWADPSGSVLGRPGIVMSFSSGVTKTSAKSSGNVTGMSIDPVQRDRLADQFVEHLVALHRKNWLAADLPSFQIPQADPFQAARWQVNWWSRVWRDDLIEPVPVVAIVESWLRANLPSCSRITMVHGDYRTGNFLFDEDTLQITAILDWELAHLGDPHEDLGFLLMPSLGTTEEGKFLVCGLMEREHFLQEYERRSGLMLDYSTLKFYEVLANFKVMVLCLATMAKAVLFKHNHQDALASWVVAAGHLYHSELCRIMIEEYSLNESVG
jgi:aminoglycoside phosphotransferase (APT) family kinase protein